MKNLVKVTLALLAALCFLSACTVYENGHGYDGGHHGGSKGPSQQR